MRVSFEIDHCTVERILIQYARESMPESLVSRLIEALMSSTYDLADKLGDDHEDVRYRREAIERLDAFKRQEREAATRFYLPTAQGSNP